LGEHDVEFILTPMLNVDDWVLEEGLSGDLADQ
jgi:hypothetical protein